jgi:hypothetical protein
MEIAWLNGKPEILLAKGRYYSLLYWSYGNNIVGAKGWIEITAHNIVILFDTSIEGVSIQNSNENYYH